MSLESLSSSHLFANQPIIGLSTSIDMSASLASFDSLVTTRYFLLYEEKSLKSTMMIGRTYKKCAKEYKRWCKEIFFLKKKKEKGAWTCNKKRKIKKVIISSYASIAPLQDINGHTSLHRQFSSSI